ncbi:hypothetical protein PF002_g14005 [Phytophthora fragariae]|uniref:Uncharacterized protein n=1 Tax=Phytophthora fragariae TaxID=53985 RepID=A0A6A3SZR8_9STRA|nr:hypothetical protein PF009_g13829 [Phytophthora fragariae]KAE9126736.1 hypothetical protein PF006_g16655 [Phytophthora fragariae]KAE9226112.1 hypothetical protein PF004_g11744 [Phytophthora fragariae]KAE9226763.1 hypothetical protein PF002_g14005 [Phytophthora fragariae]KAE9306593.1 hypothetical protein PF001_g12048 [Phytophthora fragariae]
MQELGGSSSPPPATYSGQFPPIRPFVSAAESGTLNNLFTRVARVEHPVRVKLLPVRVALVVREVPAVVGTQCACVKSPLVLSVLAVCCLKSLLTLSGSAVPCVKSLLVLSVTTFCCVKPLLVTSVLSDPCVKSLPVVPCVKSLQLLSGWEVTCVELLRVPVERGVSA